MHKVHGIRLIIILFIVELYHYSCIFVVSDCSCVTGRCVMEYGPHRYLKKKLIYGTVVVLQGPKLRFPGRQCD